MRILFVFLLALASCSHHTKKAELEDLVSLDAALNHAQSSYLKGCVDAYKEMKVSKVFEHCLGKAKLHRNEIEELIFSPVK